MYQNRSATLTFHARLSLSLQARRDCKFSLLPALCPAPRETSLTLLTHRRSAACAILKSTSRLNSSRSSFTVPDLFPHRTDNKESVNVRTASPTKSRTDSGGKEQKAEKRGIGMMRETKKSLSLGMGELHGRRLVFFVCCCCCCCYCYHRTPGNDEKPAGLFDIRQRDRHANGGYGSTSLVFRLHHLDSESTPPRRSASRLNTAIGMARPGIWKRNSSNLRLWYSRPSHTDSIDSTTSTIHGSRDYRGGTTWRSSEQQQRDEDDPNP